MSFDKIPPENLQIVPKIFYKIIPNFFSKTILIFLSIYLNNFYQYFFRFPTVSLK